MITNEFDVPVIYAAKNKDAHQRENSQSGGMFVLLSDVVLKNHGVICGCVLNDDLRAEHICTDKAEIRNKMCGSKYVQSYMGNCFKQIKEYLDSEREVLFSGTPCQVAGLKSFLSLTNTKIDRLICVDILCHGTPSPRVYSDYLKWYETRYKNKVVNYNFRNKNVYGWIGHIDSVYFENGKQVDSSYFPNLFYSHLMLSKACHSCPYKSMIHPGDVTIADFWGIDKYNLDIFDNRGVSMLMLNNTKAKDLFNEIKDKMEYVHIDELKYIQPPLKAPFEAPPQREEFWNDYESNDFTFIAKKYAKYSLKTRIKQTLRKNTFLRSIKKALKI